MIQNWLRCVRLCLIWTAVGLLASAGVAGAQTPDDLKARLEAQDRKIEQLEALIRAGTAQPAAPAEAKLSDAAVKKVVDGYMAEKEQQKKDPATAPNDPQTINQMIDQRIAEAAQKKEEEKKAAGEAKDRDGFVVGDDVGLNAFWGGRGLLFKSNNDDFFLHIGGRMMADEAYFTQSPNLRASPTRPAGSPLTNITGVGPGIGDLQDGFFIRRARFTADGYLDQVLEYKVEFDFENYNNISFDETYAGVRDLPFIDTVRIGQEHALIGLEAYTSSRFLPQLERSPLFDAFYQEFAPGIFTDTTFFDQRMTTQFQLHRIDNFSQFNGASFGDGKLAYSGRFSVLPIYEDEGRCLLHLGLAYEWRKGSPASDFNNGTTLPSTPAITNNTDVFDFRARPGIRDAVGAQGDGTRVVDTGLIIADHAQTINGELLAYWGPAWLQAETCVAQVDNVFYPASSAATNRGTLNFWGSYVQVGYFLTGENRGYDKRFGKYDRVTPLENFFLVRDENGHTQYGLGAWEINYRYAYLDLDSGSVQGGKYGEHTFGLNWYWNSNIKLQLNYIDGQRLVPAGAASGIVQAIDLRAAIEF